MKTRWMIKVESKIKEAPRGAPFILITRSLMPVTYWLKWSVKWTYEWSLNWFTLRLIFWVHIDILSSFNDYRSFTRYFTTANKYKPISAWTIESLHLQHHSRKWLSPGFLLQSIYTNASTWMSPGWLPLSIYTNGLYTYERFGTLERVLDVFFYRFNSRITCLQFKELLLRC